MKTNIVYNKNCLETMAGFGNESIDLVVTSPPYDDLRDYNGFSFDFENIAKELYRTIKAGGVVVWVVGDSTHKGNKSLTSFRQCLFFKDTGFSVYDVMIYKKTGGSPPAARRYVNAFEYMFILSKGIPKYVNLIKDKPNKYAGTYHYGIQSRRLADGTLKLSKDNKPVNEFGIRYNIWEYATGYNNSTTDKIAFEHPAIFPEKLAQDHIISWSNENDIVYDPFAGSGTTIKMALLNNRRVIGSEMSPAYCEIIRQRIEPDYKLVIDNDTTNRNR